MTVQILSRRERDYILTHFGQNFLDSDTWEWKKKTDPDCWSIDLDWEILAGTKISSLGIVDWLSSDRA